MNRPQPESSLDGAEWQRRVREAHEVGERWAFPDPTPEEEAEHQAAIAGINPTAYVGSRHHTVPRFLLERWADKNGQVQIYHRIEGRRGIENIRDLAIKDFYTIIDIEELDVTRAAAHLLGIDVGVEIGSKRMAELCERWPDEGGALARDLIVRGGLRSGDILDRRTELAAALTHGLRPTSR